MLMCLWGVVIILGPHIGIVHFDVKVSGQNLETCEGFVITCAAMPFDSGLGTLHAAGHARLHTQSSSAQGSGD